MPRFLTTPEMAAKLRYSVSRLRRAARSGRVPSVRLTPGGKLLFDEAAVEAALRQGATAATPAAATAA